MTTGVEIVEYRPEWRDECMALAGHIRELLGPLAVRIDHIGSTSVPGLAAKDTIDVQVTVGAAADLDAVAARATEAAWVVSVHSEDHVVPGLDGTPELWTKRLLHPPAGERAANIHVRVIGYPNQRYPLVFRDYLRSHPATAAAYAEAKRRLAATVPDRATYATAKNPIADLIYLPAEEWAARVGWEPTDEGL